MKTVPVTLSRRFCASMLLCALLIQAALLLSSCGKTEAGPPPVPDAADASAAGSPVKADDDSRVDLTVLSSTMVYAEVYNMVTAPEQYVGRTVRMKGTFSTYTDPGSGKVYFACIIADATACCSQGLEFELQNAADLSYPADYPEEGTDITVTGTFRTYTEGNYLYCQLADAVME